jgi:hypothetical protein
MAVKFQVEVFWVVTSCSVVVGYQRFRGPCCLHLQGRARSSEMLVSYHNATGRHNSEGLDLNYCRSLSHASVFRWDTFGSRTVYLHTKHAPPLVLKAWVLYLSHVYIIWNNFPSLLRISLTVKKTFAKRSSASNTQSRWKTTQKEAHALCKQQRIGQWHCRDITRVIITFHILQSVAFLITTRNQTPFKSALYEPLRLTANLRKIKPTYFAQFVFHK